MSVTLAELKDHLRITDTNEDSALQIYLDSALDVIEVETGRKMAQVVGRLAYFDCLGDMELIGDNATVASVEYVDTDGNTQTLSSSVYALKSHKARPYITLAYDQSYPDTRAQDAAITVTYTSGYTSSTMPSSLKSAVLLTAGSFYEHREDETIAKVHMRDAVKRLTNRYRIYK